MATHLPLVELFLGNRTNESLQSAPNDLFYGTLCYRARASACTALRVVSPVMPFLTEHLWQNLVAGVLPSAPSSIFLAGWPATAAADEELHGQDGAAAADPGSCRSVVTHRSL